MNGTIKSIRDIIHNLNNAKLDSNTGAFYPSTADMCCVSILHQQ